MIRPALMLLIATAAGCSRPASHMDAPAETVVPLTVVQFSGNRYTAAADLGLGTTVPLMVHGNSRMYLMLTHEIAAKLNGGPVGKVEDYGYSSRGKGYISVGMMRLAGATFSRISPVPVFDFAESTGTPEQGMLGLEFLIAERAVIDFSRDQLRLGAPRRSGPAPDLVARGYRAVPIEISKQRVTIDVEFPALGRTLAIVPSTVSTALTLHHPVFADKVPMVRSPVPDQSPSGTVPDLYESERVELVIGGVRLASPATFEDFAEYGKVSERDLVAYGMLGFDWMKEHQAILDYANRTLYFKP